MTSDWKLRSTLLEFKRFDMPHTNDRLAAFLESSILKWELNAKIFVVTTDSASDSVGVVSIFSDGKFSLEDHHAKCVAHVFNLAVKAYLTIVHAQLSTIQNLINSVCCSVKIRGLIALMKNIGVNDVILPQPAV